MFNQWVSFKTPQITAIVSKREERLGQLLSLLIDHACSNRKLLAQKCQVSNHIRQEETNMEACKVNAETEHLMS